jgi:hypothetical protein
MRKYLFCLLALAVCSFTNAENLKLQTIDEKNTAMSINDSLDALSKNVMSCVDNNNGEIEGCTCEDRERCPFKPELANIISSYCAAIKMYPHWKIETLSWNVEGDITGYNLATKHLEIHYGRYCEQST